MISKEALTSLSNGRLDQLSKSDMTSLRGEARRIDEGPRTVEVEALMTGELTRRKKMSTMHVVLSITTLTIGFIAGMVTAKKGQK